MRCENEFSLHGIYCYVKLGGTFNVSCIFSVQMQFILQLY